MKASVILNNYLVLISIINEIYFQNARTCVSGKRNPGGYFVVFLS